MSARWTEAEYEDFMRSRKRTLPATIEVEKRGEAPAQKVAPSPKNKNRFAENAGELGVKIAAHREQIKGQIRLWLPYPPSTNKRMSLVKGRMLKSAEARSYQKIVKEALVGLRPLTGDLEVSMQINRPQRRGDMDNVLKNCFDALTGVAFLDDEQIAMLDAKRYDGTRARDNPGIAIQINTII